MPLLVLYFGLWLLSHLYPRSCHIHGFIPYLTFDSFSIYSGLTALARQKSFASTEKPYFDVHSLNQTE